LNFRKQEFLYKDVEDPVDSGKFSFFFDLKEKILFNACSE